MHSLYTCGPARAGRLILKFYLMEEITDLVLLLEPYSKNTQCPPYQIWRDPVITSGMNLLFRFVPAIPNISSEVMSKLRGAGYVVEGASSSYVLLKKKL